MRKDPGKPLITSKNGIPSLGEWLSIVKPFNTRDLGYPEDVLDAFSGILAVLELRYGEGLISGMPAIQFNLALL